MLMNGRVARIFKGLFVVVVVGFAIWFFVRESRLERPEKLFTTSSGQVEMCLSCHTKEKLDPAHAADVVGCSPCHLGNRLAITQSAAHLGIVLNPGDLRHVEKTCGTADCHPLDSHRVKNSLMATNRGILGTLLYYWGESDSQDTDLTVEKLLTEKHKQTLGLDYFRKLCGTCHLWQKKNSLPGVDQFFNQKGGGCTACHLKRRNPSSVEVILAGGEQVPDVTKDPASHPLLSRKVTSDHCVRCHNRSGRIGISYLGMFETEGYGTPYEKGQQSSQKLPGNRFYLKLADDVHHTKNMECIDCHTREEVMGDGTSYSHYEQQLEISCVVCHGSGDGVTRKGRVLNNIERKDAKLVLRGKVDGKEHAMNPPKTGVCDFPAHKRVSCEACHSTWVAQCYGCHVRRDSKGKHLDKLSLEESSGLWEEGRSYIRYDRPMLGVWNDEVVVVTPGCQDIVTVTGEDGKIEQSFNRLTMAAINPHTTQAVGRSCADCHSSTKSVGLGEGTIVEKNGKLSFRPLHLGVQTESGTTVPLDGYVALDGTPLQNSSRPDLRPFNGEELQAILRVGLCVRCHNRYDDPIWKNYNEKTRCRREKNPLQDQTLEVNHR